jgi:hypothetical protein
LNGTSDAFVTKLNPSVSGTSALIYSTYLGGDGDDVANAVAVDATGRVYLAGSTRSSGSTFPLSTAILPRQSSLSGSEDAFVTKLDPTAVPASALLYSTYLGGTGDDRAHALAVDAAGLIYVTGNTFSPNDFPIPVPASAFDTTLNGTDDAFLAKINPTISGAGSLVYATYLGGDGSDIGRGITVNTLAQVFITGETSSTTAFPLSTGVTPFQSTLRGSRDAVLIKLDSTAAPSAALLYSTYLGGDDVDVGNAIAIDASGIAYLTGSTGSTNIIPASPPLTPLQSSQPGGGDAFVAKLNPTVSGASGLLYITYVGGTGPDVGNGIAVNSSGHVFIVGSTSSATFPNPPFASSLSPFQSTNAGGPDDAFIAKINPATAGSGGLLAWSFLGGSGIDHGKAIAIDSSNNAYVAGDTASPTGSFPTSASPDPVAFDTSLNGPSDAFIAKVVETSSSGGGGGSGISPGSGGGGGCFIATAAFGSPLAKEVQTLRAFRDRYLLTSGVGRLFVRAYYRISPSVAAAIAPHAAARALVRFSLLPVIWYAQILTRGTTGDVSTGSDASALPTGNGPAPHNTVEAHAQILTRGTTGDVPTGSDASALPTGNGPAPHNTVESNHPPQIVSKR